MKFRSKRIGVVAVLAMSVFFVESRGAAMRPSASMSGTYIWASANRIYKWDAVQNKKTVLAVIPDGMQIGALTKINADQLVFSAVNIAGPGSPYTLKNYLWLFDVHTGALKKLRPGLAPTYVATRHTLFFYAYNQRDKGFDLYSSDFHGAIAKAKVIHKGSFSSPSPVIQVSRNRIVLDYDVERAPHQVLDYDIDTEKWHLLPIQDCSPVLWRSATKQLLCTKGESFHYYLTSLEGDHRKKLKEWGAVVFSAYIRELDAAFAMRPRAFSTSEHNDVWVYYFKTGRWQKIVRGANAAQGSAVWVGARSRRPQ